MSAIYKPPPPYYPDEPVYVFDAQSEDGTKWKKHIIDNGGIATEDAIAADLTGDGRVDIVAGGRATHNIKLYVNAGTKGPESQEGR